MAGTEEPPPNDDALPRPVAIPAPALPPYLAEAQSIDETTAALKAHPFFMTSLDDATGEENIELEAIRALMHEGTRLEVAEGFRESGNEMAKMRKWADAKESYGKALVALREGKEEEEIRRKDEIEPDIKVEEVLLQEEGVEERERECGIKCLINRALCNLELQNYRSAAQDSTKALTLDPANIKAHYRLSLAHFALSKLDEAHAACSAGLILSPTNASLLALLPRIAGKQAIISAIEVKRQERETRTKNESASLVTALRLRKIRTRTTTQAPDLDDAGLHLRPDRLAPTTSTLVFPVLVLYPLHAQSDLIKAFGEEQVLASHLEYLFPVPWEGGGEYVLEEVEAYMETVEGGLLKWGKKVELLKVLSGGMVEVVDGVVRVNVVPKRRAAEWIEGMKRRRGR